VTSSEKANYRKGPGRRNGLSCPCKSPKGKRGHWKLLKRKSAFAPRDINREKATAYLRAKGILDLKTNAARA